MNVMTIEQFYERHVKPMSMAEKLRLLAMISQQLAGDPAVVETVEGSQLRTTEGDEELGVERSENRKGSPQAVLQLAGTLSAEEADTILQAAQACRQIDWEMWE